jgi:lipoprotein-releasing system ATP-binding protein
MEMRFFDIFKTLTQENQTILIVTHDIDFASKTDRIITMEDGRIIVDKWSAFFFSSLI